MIEDSTLNENRTMREESLLSLMARAWSLCGSHLQELIPGVIPWWAITAGVWVLSPVTTSLRVQNANPKAGLVLVLSVLLTSFTAIAVFALAQGFLTHAVSSVLVERPINTRRATLFAIRQFDTVLPTSFVMALIFMIAGLIAWLSFGFAIHTGKVLIGFDYVKKINEHAFTYAALAVFAMLICCLAVYLACSTLLFDKAIFVEGRQSWGCVARSWRLLRKRNGKGWISPDALRFLALVMIAVLVFVLFQQGSLKIIDLLWRLFQWGPARDSSIFGLCLSLFVGLSALLPVCIAAVLFYFDIRRGSESFAVESLLVTKDRHEPLGESRSELGAFLRGDYSIGGWTWLWTGLKTIIVAVFLLCLNFLLHIVLTY